MRNSKNWGDEMDVFDLVATLTLDSSEYEQGLGNARDSAEKGGKGIGSALGGAAKAGAAALAAATGAAVAFGASSVEAGAEFDKAMSQVAATMGYSVDDINNNVNGAGDNFNKLRDFAQEMGSSTAFSASQAADALNYMALAGYDAETSMEMLPSVLDLAASGNMDLARASDMVTDTQSALGLSVEETATLVDQMARTASKSNTSVEQLGDAMLTIGATARNVSGGTTELSTVLGVLADNGIKGAEGGTHLRNMILSLQNPTKDGVAALEQLGIAVYDSDGNMRSLIDIIGDLQAGLGEMDQAAQDAMLNDLFNKTDLAAINALLGTSSERYDELTTSIENASGAAATMAETQLDNLAGDVTMFKSALEGAQIAISDQLTPTLRNFVGFGTEALQTLTTAFIDDGLNGALDALSGIIDQGVGLLFDVLPTVIDAGIALLEGLISGILNNIDKLVDAAVKIITTLVKDLSENTDKVIDAAVDIIFALADGLIDALPQLIPAIVQIILKIVEKLTDPDTLGKLIEAAFKIIGAVAEGLIKAIPELLKSVPVIIKNLVEAIIKLVPEMVKGGVELVKGLAKGIVSAVSEAVKGIREVINKIKEAIFGVVDDARQWGRDMIGNFMSGIQQKASGLMNTVRSIGQSIRNFLGFSEPKEGPLSDFHTYAPDMMKLFAQGIKDNEWRVKDQLASSFNFSSTMGQPMLAGAGGSSTANYYITVNGIEQLDEIVHWYENRQVRARMR